MPAGVAYKFPHLMKMLQRKYSMPYENGDPSDIPAIDDLLEGLDHHPLSIKLRSLQHHSPDQGI